MGRCTRGWGCGDIESPSGSLREIADNAIDAGAELLDEAVQVYGDLLTESSRWGALTRALLCETLALTAADIVEVSNGSPKLKESFQIVGSVVCATFIEPIHKGLHP